MVVNHSPAAHGGDNEDEDVVSSAAAILAVENAALPLLVLQVDGTISMANRAIRDLLGYESSEVVGRPVWDLLVEPKDLASQRWRRLLHTGMASEHIVHFRHRDGRSIAVRTAGTVVFHADGTPRLVLKRVMAV